MDFATAPPSALRKRMASIEKRKRGMDMEIGAIRFALANRGLLALGWVVLHGVRNNPNNNNLLTIKRLREAFPGMSLHEAKATVVDRLNQGFTVRLKPADYPGFRLDVLDTYFNYYPE